MENQFWNKIRTHGTTYSRTAILTAYTVFNAILLYGHEPWRDEANVWLMAKNLSPITLFAQLKYQGHPFLWYLFVMPFAKLGFPFFTICVLSFLVMLVAAVLFIWKAPVHPLVQFVCLMSPIFSYFYPVIARNYCLAALMMVLLALLYPKRNEKPVWYGLLLGLLVQTDSIMVASAGLISLMWLWETFGRVFKEKKVKPLLHTAKGIWIPFVSVLVLGLEFWNISDSQVYEVQQRTAMEAIRGLGNYFLQILDRLTGRGIAFNEGMTVIFLIAAVIVCIQIRNVWPLVVTTGSFLFEALFSEMIYQLHIWHYIAMCFVLIWFIWIAGVEEQQKTLLRKAPYLMLQLVLLVLSVCMFIHWNSDAEPSNLQNALYGTYSGGKQAAVALEQTVPKDGVIISTNVARASTVLAYTPDRTFYYAVELAPRSFATWSASEEATIPLTQVLDWVRLNFPDQTDCYILDSEEGCLTDTEALQESTVLYRSTEEAMARDEHYTLYQVPLS